MAAEHRVPMVVVTGGTGFLGGVLIKQLIDKGFMVRATVRDLYSDRARQLQTAFPRKLRLFQANLLDPPEVYAEAFAGCQCVFHAASPFYLAYDDPQKDIVDPAVIGTTNVVKQALASQSVKKIILTSSISTLIGSKGPDHVYTELDNNESATLQEAPFPLGKIKAEKIANELVAASGSDVSLVIINAGFMLGAPATRTPRGVAIQTVTAMLSGLLQAGARPVQYAISDVGDVARAQVAAFESKEAHGRYIVASTRYYTMLEVANGLRPFFPYCILPSKTSDPHLMTPSFKLDNSKVTRELGIQLTPLETTLKDMGMALIRLGFLSEVSMIRAQASAPLESQAAVAANNKNGDDDDNDDELLECVGKIE